jgi:hypothetical protein
MKRPGLYRCVAKDGTVAGVLVADGTVDRAPQHLQALERANAVRLQRAQMKRWIRQPEDSYASRERAIAVLLDPTAYPHAMSMPVGELLRASRRMGPTMVRRLLHRARIGEMREVGRLTFRQASELAGLLRRDGLTPTLWDQPDVIEAAAAARSGADRAYATRAIRGAHATAPLRQEVSGDRARLSGEELEVTASTARSGQRAATAIGPRARRRA